MEAVRAAGATTVPAPLSADASDESSGGLATISWFLIPTFAAAALLLSLAAMPPAWTIRAGFPARLVNRREDLAMFGGIILLQSGILALLASI